MPKEKFGAIFVNGRMIDIDKASLLELKDLSDRLREQENSVRNQIEKILKK
ncbi:MAG: hypothetical protein IJ223_03175 [Clostridia bacterium]|nr:hypothetical protein [Clostridia bacterium]